MITTSNPTVGQHDLLWGHRHCPGCSTPFLVTHESMRFFARYHGDVIFFMLCKSCADKYDRLSQKHRAIFQDDCILAVKHGKFAPELWACTTDLAMTMNAGDITSSIEHGTHGMDQVTYEAIVRSDQAIIFLNGGPVTWKPATSHLAALPDTTESSTSQSGI